VGLSRKLRQRDVRGPEHVCEAGLGAHVHTRRSPAGGQRGQTETELAMRVPHPAPCPRVVQTVWAGDPRLLPPTARLGVSVAHFLP
jgi:hypothetical protein